MNFGARLKEVIEKKGIRQTMISDLTGISRQQLSRILNKDQQPRDALDISAKLSEHLDVCPHWLAFGIGNQDASTQLISLNVLSGNDLKDTGTRIPVDASESDNLIAYRIETTVLAPEIQKGAVAIINKSKQPQDGDYILFKDGSDNLLVRKIIFNPPNIILSSSQSETTCTETEIKIIGVIQEFRIIL